MGFDYIRVFQVSDGAGEFEDAVEGSGGKVKLLHCRLQKAAGGFFYLAKFPYLGWRHLVIASQSGSPEAFLLSGAGGFNSGLNLF